MHNSKLLFELEELYDRQVKLAEHVFIEALEAEKEYKRVHYQLKEVGEHLKTIEDLIVQLGGNIKSAQFKGFV